MSNPKCIVCGKPIAKRMIRKSFISATLNRRQNYEQEGPVIYLDEEFRPKTIEEAARFTNHTILRVGMMADYIFDITWWEGGYEDEFFHSQRCAAKQGYASAQHGARFTWSEQSS